MSQIQWGDVGEWFGGIATTAAVLAGASVLRVQLRLGRAQLAEITEGQIRQLNVSYLPSNRGGNDDDQIAVTNHGDQVFREISVVMPNGTVETCNWSRESFTALAPGERRVVNLPVQVGNYPQFVTAFVKDNLGNRWCKDTTGLIKSVPPEEFERYAYGAGLMGFVTDHPFFQF